MCKKLNDKDIMNLLIDTALSCGASEFTRRLGKDENIERYEDFDTGLRVFIGNKIASVSTNESAENAIREVAKRAVEMAKIAPQDDFSLIADTDTLSKFPLNNFLIDCYDNIEPSVDIIRDRASKLKILLEVLIKSLVMANFLGEKEKLY